MATFVAAAILQPFIALVAAMALLIPVAAALPYFEIRSLRRLMVLAWAAVVGIGAARSLPDDLAVAPVAGEFLRLWGLTLVSGVVLFLLYQSSERLKASSREFRRLFQLSSDLAETTEPAVLGELVARHLAEATGFDDCVIYALAPETGRFAPFGSYPVERSLETDPESLVERPLLGRVIHDRARIVIDAADELADPTEQARLRALGREVMLLLPLVALSEPVGVAELTAGGHRPVDERRLALARTLAFEAAMAIENGRLYHELRHRALHDSLTGLANRSLFHDRVEHALARLARREGATVAVLFVDRAVSAGRQLGDTDRLRQGDERQEEHDPATEGPQACLFNRFGPLVGDIDDDPLPVVDDASEQGPRRERFRVRLERTFDGVRSERGESAGLRRQGVDDAVVEAGRFREVPGDELTEHGGLGRLGEVG